MRAKAHIALSAGLALAMILGLGAACIAPATPTTRPGETPAVATIDDPVDGYLALAPRVLHSGQAHSVPVSLFHGRQPANATVQLALTKGGQALAQAEGRIQGRGDLTLPVPALAEGEYELQLSGKGFQATSAVRVEEGTLVFLESDKPLYKPGQTVHFRVLTLDSSLRPLPAAVTLEVADAKGLKIYKKELQSDDYGMITADLPISDDPNLGVWKATVQAGKRQAQLDVRVERYVLPKYEVTVNLAKEWALASEPIVGSIAAEYSYGKPVQGEVEIVATRYVGTWQEFARVTRELAGQVDFSLPAAGYVAGVPGEQGMGNVQLDVTVREKATGYEEKTTRLVTVAQAPVVISAIPESVAFKPGLPLSVLFVAETPDKKPADAVVAVHISYMKDKARGDGETRQVTVKGGQGLLTVTPPADAIGLSVVAYSGDSYANLALKAGHSPTGSFVHVGQTSTGALRVGDTAHFRVTATKQATGFYYEVLARGRVVFSDYSRSSDIALTLTPAMAPSARLLVYQILPTSEVAADYVPFSVSGDYPQQVQASFSQAEVRPGDPVDVNVQTEGPARVGLAAVDRSVFILAENRLNLQQVFDELERLYQKPQVELHEATPFDKITTWGAGDVFRDAGVVVLSNQQVPAGKEYESPVWRELERGAAIAGAVPAAAPQAAVEDGVKQAEGAGPGLAEVQRVRQFFPETWLWLDLTTDGAGKATAPVQAPDSITTWMLRAVALSKEQGLGVAEAELKVLQPFFVSVDLPYACIRGEEFPVQVALYNYTDTPQTFTVELERGDWFDLLGPATQTVTIGGNDLGGAAFTIRPNGLGTRQVKVTARSTSEADAVIKDIIVEPEGVARELVENLVLSAGASRPLDTSVPFDAISGSGRSFLAVTGSYLTQAIDGLEGLIRMPFGCGEQNMILFAPNVFVARYLRETNQMKPEVMTKAESMMMTGYQRELIYRRGDGSFSAFGESDAEGSLWLTAFVLKTFAQARELIYIDDAMLASAKAWVVQHQKSDGSFEPVGFVHHQEMLGGLQGKTALTAYVAVCLKEAGEGDAFGRAVRYLEGALPQADDAYTLALGAYALELAKSPKAGEAYERLLQAAHEADDSLSWGDYVRDPEPLPDPLPPRLKPGLPEHPNRSAAVETTGYALLALLEHGDRLNAARAARWLVGQRNALGGYASTQDTVVALQALTAFAANAKSDVDATVTLSAGSFQKQVRVGPENADVMQFVDLPVGQAVNVAVAGQGQVVLQAVRRFNLPQPEPLQPAFQVDVRYGAEQVAVNDLLDVAAAVRFTPPEPLQAGMVVVDIAVPTGFAPEADTVAAAVTQDAKIKRSEIAGRKVVFYIEDMAPGDEVDIAFQARALYPVRAQAVPSQAYAYYRPEMKGESLGAAVVVQ
ncbi:MAG TPA: alpha-2-macroglobulin family protein [Anaerolineae bacterium]|nr:alpha-2-macroglobulin family protein [Anaerolineae bacterium]HOR01335.1 alpha-2-macroglobulin family protein [Anaerolineae bacterium]